MPEGTHELLFYNNDTEYIVFDGVAASDPPQPPHAA